MCEPWPAWAIGRAPAPAPTPTLAPALAPVPALNADADVQAFLRQARLSSHEQALYELGVSEMADLRELSDDDLLEAGLKKLEIKRFKRYLDAAAA